MRRRERSVLAAVALLYAGIGPAAQAADEIGGYLLEVGDVIEFDFLDDEEEPRQLTVGSDGRVQAPLVGGVTVVDLTLSAARERLAAAYVERRILVDPKIDLAIVNYRPVFVLGDVKHPGSFPFQPNLTVVQAIGLAGGPATALSSEEDRLLARATLTSEITAIESDIARQAVWAGRINATLAGRAQILPDDLPEATRPFLNSVFVSVLEATEELILEVEDGAHRQRRDTLAAAVAGAEHALALAEERVENHRTTIGFGEEELTRAKELKAKGLMPASRVAALERQSSADTGTLLSLHGQVAEASRALAELRSQLADLEAERRRTALVALQERQVTIEKLLADRKAAEDKLALVSSWSDTAAMNPEAASFAYVIRRKTVGGVKEIEASQTTALGPGDVVTVTLRRPGTEG